MYQWMNASKDMLHLERPRSLPVACTYMWCPVVVGMRIPNIKIGFYLMVDRKKVWTLNTESVVRDSQEHGSGVAVIHQETVADDINRYRAHLQVLTSGNSLPSLCTKLHYSLSGAHGVKDFERPATKWAKTNSVWAKLSLIWIFKTQSTPSHFITSNSHSDSGRQEQSYDIEANKCNMGVVDLEIDLTVVRDKSSLGFWEA